MDIGGRSIHKRNRRNYFDSNYLSIQTANNIFVNQSGDEMMGNLDMKSNKIINVKDPEDLQDVTTKKYLDNTVGNIVRSIPDKIREYLFDSNNKIKYELLPIEKDANIRIKESFHSFIKIINVNLETFPTEITFINDNGIILQNTYLSNIYHKPRGTIISIQLIEYEINGNIWLDNKSDELKKYIRVENGYLIHLGASDRRLIVLAPSGKYRIYVLMSPLSITVGTIPKITVEIAEKQNVSYTITPAMGLL